MSSMNSINIDEKKDLELFKILLKKVKNIFSAIIGTGFGLRVIYNTLKYFNRCKIKFIYSRKKTKKAFLQKLKHLKKIQTLKVSIY